MSSPVTVTVENFARAESDLYFSRAVGTAGLAKFEHNRAPTAIDQQMVIRMNRDTLYSMAVFDLDAGPATVILPDAGKRFMSLEVINQDHYVVGVHYGAGSYQIDRATAGTRYILTALRTLADPADPKDIAAACSLQDAVRAQQENRGTFEIPNWDPVSQKKVREALAVLGSTLTTFDRAFGAKNQVDPIRHLIGSAVGWGGNPDKDARYTGMSPARNDGLTIHRLKVRDVPVDGFWSVTVYNADGYLEPNPSGIYSINNITAKRSSDGSVEIQFGGCDGKVPNCIPITPGWNYTVRMYRPRPEILDGTWKFPEAQPID
jgi:hypothetical protein